MKLYILTCVLCVLVLCENVLSDSDPFTKHIRVKRGKYYSGPPQKIYRRPPFSFPVSGAFSYTPPPGYMMDDDDSHPGNQRPYKVSKRAPPSMSHEGLGEDDINNIVKYLSKKDLNKIVQLASNKIRSNNNMNNLQGQAPRLRPDEPPQFKSQENDADSQYFFNGPYANPPVTYLGMTPTQQSYSNQQPNKQGYQMEPLKSEESMETSQLAFLNTHIESEIWGDNGSGMKEEILPKPVNLREHDDFEVSFSKNVPTIVKAESYKVEDFSGLPLMDYSSKLHTVSSYKVPHYTVTSPRPSLPNVPPPAPLIERAPSSSAAHTQSDAHLKAVKIWTHKSKGTAYTLHDDGTLSLELPRTRYSHP